MSRICFCTILETFKVKPMRSRSENAVPPLCYNVTPIQFREFWTLLFCTFLITC